MNSVSLPKRVLAVAAHPDDIEISCGGAMALYRQAGSDVVLAAASNGNRGGKGISMTEIGTIREAEARRAADLIGAQYICLQFDDGEVPSSMEARPPFIDLIRNAQPDIIFTHHPNDYHPDHVAVSRQVVAASFTAASELLDSSATASKSIPPVFYMETLAGVGFQPEEYVDITSAIETKRRMLACHSSQFEWMRVGGIDLAELVETTGKFRGFQAGVTFAEGFISARHWLRGSTRGLLP